MNLSFCNWFISLSVMSSRCMLQPVSEHHSFLRLSNIPLYVYVTFGLSAHPSPHIEVLLPWDILNDAMNMSVQIFESLL